MRLYYGHDVIILDGTPPSKIRAYAREDLLPYTTVKYTVGKFASIDNVNNGTRFVVTDTNGAVYSARKFVLAAGVTDILPNFPGMAVIWGTGAFWCLYVIIF
jgi:thioredoxin reductase